MAETGQTGGVQPWYRDVYRRSVIDMHITHHDPRFMGRFDAQRYADAVATAQAGSAVVYAQSCVGLTYFPTRVGEMHRGLHGRDILREMLGELNARGVASAVYMAVIFDRWAYDHDSDWRIRRADGAGAADRGRIGVVCPNSPYRDYAVALAEEISSNYDFGGLRFDMTFWPRPCYCRHCRRRFQEEVGADLPETVNWEDPVWVAFQRRREAWLVEFASLLTAAVKRHKPDASVEHQASTYAGTWRWGVSYALARQNTFLQGDFYGDIVQGSFARKLFGHLSENQPGGFETSISVDLANYTALKSEALLACKASAALADGCAFIFIDSIDPEGTLNLPVYERMGRVAEHTKAYERYLGGQRREDVAIYLSTESKCDFADNGKHVEDAALSGHMPHVDAAFSAGKSLMEAHIPYGVVTHRDLDALDRHAVLVLPNLLMMDEAEVSAVREFVRRGGCLYASKYTSLIDVTGRRHEDFMLADVFGVHYRGQTAERFSYAEAADGPAAGQWDSLFPGFTRSHPLGLYGQQLIVASDPSAEVLARITLPYTDPDDPDHYASLHNNPPGRPTAHPAIVLHRYGQGKVIYVAGELENADWARQTFVALLRLLQARFSWEADAARPVELTVFDQAGPDRPEAARSIISLVNFQRDMPNIPVMDTRVRVRPMAGRTPAELLLLPSETPQPYDVEDGYVVFTVPCLDTFAMYALNYRQHGEGAHE